MTNTLRGAKTMALSCALVLAIGSLGLAIESRGAIADADPRRTAPKPGPADGQRRLEWIDRMPNQPQDDRMRD